MSERSALDAIADSLMPAVASVRRTLWRVGGTAYAHDSLTAAQYEVVLLVGRQPQRSVSEIAHELGLAPNTVSTIVSRLVAAGLLRRDTDPSDRRVGRLSLSTRAQAQADAYRARRREVLRDALLELDPGQVEELRAGISALAALEDALARRSTDYSQYHRTATG